MDKNPIGGLYRKFFNGLAFLLFVLVSACSQDDDASPNREANTHVNDWILANMEFWYLWNSELPASPDRTQNPDEFFKSLVYSGDRFSWIQEDYQELLNSLQGINKEAGFEYVLYKEDGSNNVITQILYVKPNSPASNAGLKRGDVITQINGQKPNTTNYQEVLKGMSAANFSITYKQLILAEERFDVEKTASLSTVVYTEDPNYLHKVIEINTKKVGYYIYNFFSSGTDSNEDQYDQEMDAVFADFKAAGVTDLVLDLRFNSGGSETSATNLASLIAPDANSSKIFFKKEYNEKVEEEILKDQDAGPAALQRDLITKAQNIGSQLGGRVFVLTGSRTASASELIINGLTPYMTVVLIGDVTYGKNVGSISIYDEEDPKNTWGMQPIVLKVYNALDESEYSEGFTPNFKNEDNNVIIHPLGDLNEALLNKALEEITGSPVGGRKAQPSDVRETIGFSMDAKRRSFILNVKR